MRQTGTKCRAHSKCRQRSQPVSFFCYALPVFRTHTYTDTIIRHPPFDYNVKIHLNAHCSHKIYISAAVFLDSPYCLRLSTKFIFKWDQQPRGSAHEKAFAVQTHENRGHAPRFLYFKREKVSIWELLDDSCSAQSEHRLSEKRSFSTVFRQSLDETAKTTYDKEKEL